MIYVGFLADREPEDAMAMLQQMERGGRGQGTPAPKH